MLKKGTQVAYIPNHVNGDINHPDVEYGFIFNVVQTGYRENDITYFCRFWQKGKPGILRTVSNSEKCFDYQLAEHMTVGNNVVDNALEIIRAANRQ